jgi:hypothetical protein
VNATDNDQPSTNGSLRMRGSPLRLIREAIGGKAQVAGKLARLMRTARTFAQSSELDRRLQTLARRGYLERSPSRLQLGFAALDMFRFVIVPAARDYYAQRGIDFHFHQLLRFLDDPVSLVDPTGLLSERDTIIGHLMQVVHLNPIYDLQLLEMFDDGLDELERQLEQMIDGTHPRARTVGAIVEDVGYHGRLLDYLRRYRADPHATELVREQSLRADPSYAAAERTFASLPGFLGYAAQLPRSPRALLARRRRLRSFPVMAETADRL